RPRPGRGLRPPQGLGGGRSGTLAGPDPELRAVGRRPSSPARGPPLRSPVRGFPLLPEGRREGSGPPFPEGRIRRAGVFRRGRRRLGRGRSVRGFARRALS